MIYQVKKNDVTLEIDDNIFFDKQPEVFRRLYEAGRVTGFKDENGNATGTAQTDNVDFDNCHVEVYGNGRVIITVNS